MAREVTRQTGLNSQAAADIGHLFASSAATTRAVVGTTTMVFFVFGGIFAAAALQQIYEQAFDLPHRRIKDLPHRLAWLAWLAVLIGASLLSGWAGPGLRHAGGLALLAVTGLVCATGFWWLTMQILLAGRISWRALFPAACATGVLYLAMQAVFSLVFSAMVISSEHTYGPIGTIFAVLSYLIAIGVVVILGAVAGRAWHERSPGTSETGQLTPAEHEDARRSGRGAVAFGDSEVSPPPVTSSRQVGRDPDEPIRHRPSSSRQPITNGSSSPNPAASRSASTMAVIAWFRSNKRWGRPDKIHAPWPSAPACELYRAVAIRRLSCSAVMN